jgi:hypothetical protein
MTIIGVAADISRRGAFSWEYTGMATAFAITKKRLSFRMASSIFWALRHTAGSLSGASSMTSTGSFLMDWRRRLDDTVSFFSTNSSAVQNYGSATVRRRSTAAVHPDGA